ncbi:MAG: cyclic nucleotide-binding domain-containing protein [Defluviitaleaceae bacterium]|nr:cyclic nucleotide-binding domain-containing protein [Defluviitaleaceae bacterium]
MAKYGLRAADFPTAARLSSTAGAYLSREGEALSHVYLVLSGKAKVLLSLSDGKQLLLAYFISQGIIGDIELMTDITTHAATLQAVTDLECIALPLDDCRAQLKHNAAFANAIGKELAVKLHQRAINGTINTLQPLETRLCAYIFQTAINNIFDEKLTEVAAVMGASYRHVLRCFTQLCTQSILIKQGKTYHVNNRSALEAQAGDRFAWD